MSSEDADKTPAEKLAEAVARKAAAHRGAGGHAPKTGRTERADAARAASKSRPAPRKG